MRSTNRVRNAMTSDRLIVLGVAVALGVAACAALEESPELAPAAPIAMTASTPRPSTTTSTSTSTTTTSIAATTTAIAPGVEAVGAVCESLRTDGFETRRVMADALPSAFLAECGDALSRLEGAVEIRERMQIIDMAEEDGLHAMSLTDFSCAAGTFEVKVTNDAAIPLGLHANFAMYRDSNREDSLQSSLEPIVIWSLAPGATETIHGRFHDLPNARISCDFEAQVFDADPSPADASLGDEPEYPALTGDDPSVWFPALSELERGARTSGDIDLAAVTEDVRSMAYDEVALAISEGDEFPDTELLEICERGRSLPDADHIGFVYRERLSGETRLSHGLFRRGADGQWRWLSTARYYESTLSADCAGVDPAI